MTSAAPPPPRPEPDPPPHPLARWWDPEWLAFVGFLLAPSAGLFLAGQTQRASFFFGTAVYLGVLKWLGRVVLGPRPRDGLSFLLFPAELFLGLALLCGWFYLRTLLGLLWPASYSLRELTLLPYLVGALHTAGALVRVRALGRDGASRREALRALGRRALVYGPFAFMLLVALWRVSPTLHLHSLDPNYHAFSARVYLNDGLFCRRFNGGEPIAYPSGFGAINTVTVAVTPLTVVQAVNLQHVLWLVAALFLITSTVARLARRPLWLVHGLPLPFLAVFPLYSLYPYVTYEGTPRQVAPALLTALCLLPVVAAVGRPRSAALLAAYAVLAVLTVALNPACLPFAALAVAVNLALVGYQAVAVPGPRWWRVVGFQVVLLAVASLAVLGGDEYYRGLARQFLGTGSVVDGGVSEVQLGPPASGEAPFSAARALQGAASLNLFGLTPPQLFLEVYRIPELRDWHERLPYRAFPGMVLATAAAALVAAWRNGLLADRESGARPVATFLAACAALWVLCKLGPGLAGAGLSADYYMTALMKMYVTLMAVRCELLLGFAAQAAAGVCLYLAAERARARRGARPLSRTAVAPLLLVMPYLGVLAAPDGYGCGYVVVPNRVSGGVITEDDLRLVAWANANLPPEKGLIGLAGSTMRLGIEGKELHLHPVAGAAAMLHYGTRYNFCFAPWDPSLPYSFEAYERHVKDDFDPKWCLCNNVRYFYVTRHGLAVNPGLARAIDEGVLRPVRIEGDSGIYKVTARGRP